MSSQHIWDIIRLSGLVANRSLYCICIVEQQEAYQQAQGMQKKCAARIKELENKVKNAKQLREQELKQAEAEVKKAKKVMEESSKKMKDKQKVCTINCIPLLQEVAEPWDRSTEVQISSLATATMIPTPPPQVILYVQKCSQPLKFAFFCLSSLGVFMSINVHDYVILDLVGWGCTTSRENNNTGWLDQKNKHLIYWAVVLSASIAVQISTVLVNWIKIPFKPVSSHLCKDMLAGSNTVHFTFAMPSRTTVPETTV